MKNIIIQEYAIGGLKMVNYADFITALKAWIRRLSSELNIDRDNMWIH